MINGGFLDNTGLYRGEMGLVVFFLRYARYTQNELYTEYSYGLIDNLWNRINYETPIDYKNGLAGIGSGIEYLVQKGFVEADTDELLEDFDDRIFFTFNLQKLPIEDIMDIGYYASWRLSGNSSKKDIIQQTVLPQIEKVMHERSVNPVLILSFTKTRPASFFKKTSGHCTELIEKNVFWNQAMGLQDGLAGWGLSLLTELDGDDSWFSLLPNDITL